MSDYLRLRQICLAAPSLEPVVEAVQQILGLAVCHRDPGVGKYGLENALFTCGHAFLEVVAPTREGTAVHRFLERSGGRGGYMAIFDCSDPERRRAHVQAQGVRVAHALEYPDFWGTQFHPRDCRATMLEFDRSAGGESLSGAYWPAGPHWRDAQRLDRVAGLPAIALESPDADGLAAHWSRLTGVPLTRNGAGQAELRFDLGAACFVAAPPGTPERLAVVELAVPAPAEVLAAARRHGCPLEADGFVLAGVRIRPVLVVA
ncbi:MAG: VOC family protein [Burkholderiales bacterium]|nr:VOC family protein [Burkholderiales bacterium]